LGPPLSLKDIFCSAGSVERGGKSVIDAQLDNHLDNITIGCARNQCKTIKPVPTFPRAASIEPCQIFREAGKIAYRPAKILAPDLLQSGKAAQVILHVSSRCSIPVSVIAFSLF
jgi:hypothetical protein